MKTKCLSRYLTVVFTALLVGCATSTKTTIRVKTMALAKIPNISQFVLSAQGKEVRIDDPVLYLPSENEFLFSVSVLGSDWRGAEQEYQFVGDAVSIDNFVREVQFVNEQHGGLGEGTIEFGVGARDEVEDMAKGLLDLVFHPIKNGSAIVAAGGGAYDYLRDNYSDYGKIQDDFYQFCDAYVENVYMSEAADFGLNYEELQTEVAKADMRKLGKAKIAGAATTETLTLCVGWLKISKVAKASEIGSIAAKAGEAGKAAEAEEGLTAVGRCGKLFEYGTMADKGAKRMAVSSAIAARISALDLLTPLLKPDDIKTLISARALNPRLHKVIYHLHQSELEGRNISETLTRAMKSAGADRRIPNMLLDPKIDHAQILKNYQLAKDLGVFNDADNLERMRHGMAPLIHTPRGYQIIEVDHEVPVSWAKELGNSWGNLSYQPQDYNRMRGNLITKNAMDKLLQYKNEGMLTQKRIDEIIRTATKVPAPTK